jgi:hypothetical protein
MARPSLPSPRGDAALCDSLLTQLTRYPQELLVWEAVTARGYGSWVGVTFEDLEWSARPWVLDVTGRGEGGGDPLAVEVHHDVLTVTVRDESRPGVQARMVSDLPGECQELTLPATAFPGPPWTVHFDVGWSVAAITSGLQRWVDTRAGRDDLRIRHVNDSAETTLTQTMGPLIQATEVAFDLLLTLDPLDAAIICQVFAAVAEAVTD